METVSLRRKDSLTILTIAIHHAFLYLHVCFFVQVNVCLAQSIEIPQSDDLEEWNAMFDTMGKAPDAKAVFISAPSETILKVLRHMESRSLAGRYVILAGPSWDLTDDDIQDLNVTQGMRKTTCSSKPHEKFLSPCLLGQDRRHSAPKTPLRVYSKVSFNSLILP